MTSGREPANVEIMTGFPNPVGDAMVSVMSVDTARVLLGIDEPDGTETTQWYAADDILTASGRRWRVTRLQAPEPLGDDASPGAGSGRTVAVLEPIASPGA